MATDQNVTTRATVDEKAPSEKPKTFEQRLHEKIALVGDENLRGVLFDVIYGDSKDNPGHAEFGQEAKPKK